MKTLAILGGPQSARKVMEAHEPGDI
ncbi:hypothetical protein LCGC14_2765620, partial [marine sediment metagenome]